MASFLIYPGFEKIEEKDDKYLVINKGAVSLYDSLNIGLLAYDYDSEKVYSNYSTFTLLGVTPDDDSTKLLYLASIVEEQQLKRMYRNLKKMIKGSINRFEDKFRFHMESKSRIIKVVCVKESEVFNSNGNNIYAFFTDLTSSIDQYRSRFLSEITHDLRLPIGTMLQCVESINDDCEPKRDIYMDILKQSILHLKSLSDHYLSYSVETSVTHLKPVRFNLWQTFNNLYLIHSVGISTDISLSMTSPKDSCLVYMDKFCIEQIMNNLLSNAKKYTFKGAIAFGYTFTQDGGLDIFVSDTGVGISEEFQAKIFEPYYQKEKYEGGVGLGLSICKRRIDRMGGEINVYSRLNFGTRFVISFGPNVIVKL